MKQKTKRTYVKRKNEIEFLLACGKTATEISENIKCKKSAVYYYMNKNKLSLLARKVKNLVYRYKDKQLIEGEVFKMLNENRICKISKEKIDIDVNNYFVSFDMKTKLPYLCLKEYKVFTLKCIDDLVEMAKKFLSINGYKIEPPAPLKNNNLF